MRSLAAIADSQTGGTLPGRGVGLPIIDFGSSKSLAALLDKGIMSLALLLIPTSACLPAFRQNKMAVPVGPTAYVAFDRN